MNYKAYLDKAANLFHIKSAVAHWRYQRYSAVILLPLTIWLIILLDKVVHAPYSDTVAWLAAPLNTLAILLWIVTVIYHSALGVQVVLEDYISDIPLRERIIFITNLIFLTLGVVASLCIFITVLAR